MFRFACPPAALLEAPVSPGVLNWRVDGILGGASNLDSNAPETDSCPQLLSLHQQALNKGHLTSALTLAFLEP